jgi:hypothetical protein
MIKLSISVRIALIREELLFLPVCLLVFFGAIWARICDF